MFFKSCYRFYSIELIPQSPSAAPQRSMLGAKSSNHLVFLVTSPILRLSRGPIPSHLISINSGIIVMKDGKPSFTQEIPRVFGGLYQEPKIKTKYISSYTVMPLNHGFTCCGFSYLLSTSVQKYEKERSRNKQFISFKLYTILGTSLHLISSQEG